MFNSIQMPTPAIMRSIRGEEGRRLSRECSRELECGRVLGEAEWQLSVACNESASVVQLK